MRRVAGRLALLVAGGVVAIAAAWLLSARIVRDRLPAGDYQPRLAAAWVVPEREAAGVREDALRRAQVWREPAQPIEHVQLWRSAGEMAPHDTPLACKFFPQPLSGTTPKFDCILPGGDVVKVKYGRTPEIHAELAATRLLAALGFGADRMYLVPRLRCHGCPRDPFRTYRALELTQMDERYNRRLDYEAYTEFEWVSVERRLDAPAITAPGVKGWAFHELAAIDPAQGGAPRAHVDALRLIAAFLHHWDNKAENQRLVCLAPPKASGNGACPAPLAVLNDLGATFGPPKVDLASWSARPVWKDEAACGLSMKGMPADGATFQDVHISEEGRRFLAERLGRLSQQQVRDLFAGARFGEFHSRSEASVDVTSWVHVFQRKVREISDRPPCPTFTSAVSTSPSPRSTPSG
jgi:hypothetical protein